MPAVAALPAASVATGGAGGLGLGAGMTRFAGALLPNLLGEILGGFLRPGGVVPSSTTMPVGNKYNLSAGEVQNMVRMADEINFRRRMIGLEEINPDELIGKLVETNRLLMKEAGEREYAIEQLRQQGTVQSALASQIGPSMQAQADASRAVIENLRPGAFKLDPELGRAY